MFYSHLEAIFSIYFLYYTIYSFFEEMLGLESTTGPSNWHRQLQPSVLYYNSRQQDWWDSFPLSLYTLTSVLSATGSQAGQIFHWLTCTIYHMSQQQLDHLCIQTELRRSWVTPIHALDRTELGPAEHYQLLWPVYLPSWVQEPT